MQKKLLSGYEYTDYQAFAKEHVSISYKQFEASLLDGISLFTLCEELDLDSLEQTVDRISATLPAIRRLFSRPITRLTDRDEIMPIEAVRRINNHTVTHASGHSELWDDLTPDGIKPKKLLTVGSDDDFVIYENIAFIHMVDIIRRFVSDSIRALRSMLFSDPSLSFNLLERTNHPAYFLALGKLHYGYASDHGKYDLPAQRIYNKLLFIERVTRAAISSEVYKRCIGKDRYFKLKKTTVFRTHKDYRRVYSLLKWFSQHGLDPYGIREESDGEPRLKEGYDTFCLMVCIFAAAHFNFRIEEAAEINFDSTSLCACFCSYQLKISTLPIGEIKGVRITVTKDSTYSVILIPAPDAQTGARLCKLLPLKYDADEFVALTDEPSDESSLCVSLYSIDSFRRIQQLLLRSLIRSADTYEVCPFCSSKQMLTPSVDGEDESHLCTYCRTIIKKKVCPTAGLPFLSTSMMGFTPPIAALSHESESAEGLMSYRNITRINARGNPICPYCNSVH